MTLWLYYTTFLSKKTLVSYEIILFGMINTKILFITYFLCALFVRLGGSKFGPVALASGGWFHYRRVDWRLACRPHNLDLRLVYKKKPLGRPVIVYFFILALYWLFSFIPLYYTNVLNDQCLKLWGVNRLVFGSFVGMVLMQFAILVDKYARLKNDGKVFFPYQKVVFPISTLMVASLILYFICK